MLMYTKSKRLEIHAGTLTFVAHMLERKPSELYPDVRDEDLFKCFLCKQWKPALHYNHGLAHHAKIDASVLDDYKENGHIWACDNCFLCSGLFACKTRGAKQFNAYYA